MAFLASDEFMCVGWSKIKKGIHFPNGEPIPENIPPGGGLLINEIESRHRYQPGSFGTEAVGPKANGLKPC
jgi:hypothetical protein